MSRRQDDIIQKRAELIQRYGEWWDNFELAEGIWTLAPSHSPNPRWSRSYKSPAILPKSPCRIVGF